MRIVCEIDETDVTFVMAKAADPKNSKRIEDRRREQAGRKRDHSDAAIWRAMMVCLLTTRQRSTPGTALNTFCEADPFGLRYGLFEGLTPRSIGAGVSRIISNEGLWRANLIGEAAEANIERLRDGAFDAIRRSIAAIAQAPDPAVERAAVDTFLQLKGIGPKQSRNMLLNLGVLHYEIPIDSRVMGWLREHLKRKGALPLSDKSMADPELYNLVLDQLQALAGRAGLAPADLDAIMFAEGGRGQARAKKNRRILKKNSGMRLQRA